MLNSKTMIARRARKRVLAFGLQPSAFACSGFTMVEIAICLAIIGIALVAIIGVLPLGINVQKDNRQETLVDQDATVFMENIRNGARGLDGLTNYVYLITNNWTLFNPDGTTNQTGANYYTYTNDNITTLYPTGSWLTNGANVIGLLSTPKYTLTDGAPLDNTNYARYYNLNFYENHVVAYVHSLSGPAVEKPPQNNDTIIGGSFSYKIMCDNAPMAVYTPPDWQDRIYNEGDQVFYDGVSWRAIVAGNPASPPQAGDQPGISPRWLQASYPQQLTANLRQLRLAFLWPLLPNGNTGNGRHTFATTVAGQVVAEFVNPNVNSLLYFFQPQTFTAAP